MNSTISHTRLEEMMFGQAKCESNHGASNNECSFTPTHRFMPKCGPGEHRNICAKATAWVSARLASGRNCATCHTPVKDCWVVVPV